MANSIVISHGDTVAVVLPKALVEAAGLSVGDSVHVALRDRQLILQPVEDAERTHLMGEIAKEVMDQRADAYRRLA